MTVRKLRHLLFKQDQDAQVMIQGHPEVGCTDRLCEEGRAKSIISGCYVMYTVTKTKKVKPRFHSGVSAANLRPDYEAVPAVKIVC